MNQRVMFRTPMETNHRCPTRHRMAYANRVQRRETPQLFQPDEFIKESININSETLVWDEGVMNSWAYPIMDEHSTKRIWKKKMV